LNDSVDQVNVSFSILCCEGTKKLAKGTNLISYHMKNILITTDNLEN
jgi:hypothetical protein